MLTDGPTDGRTDGRTHPLIEMRGRIQKIKTRSPQNRKEEKTKARKKKLVMYYYFFFVSGTRVKHIQVVNNQVSKIKMKLSRIHSYFSSSGVFSCFVHTSHKYLIMTHCKIAWNLLFINLKRFCHTISVSVYLMSIPLYVFASNIFWSLICVFVGPYIGLSHV